MELEAGQKIWIELRKTKHLFQQDSFQVISKIQILDQKLLAR